MQGESLGNSRAAIDPLAPARETTGMPTEPPFHGGPFKPPLNIHEIDDRERWICFGCGIRCGRGNGISMSGDTNDRDTRYELCFQCRDALSLRDRILMNMLLRSREQGGLGLVETFEEFAELMRVTATETGKLGILELLNGGAGMEGEKN